jgi:hypothetical protein
MMKVLVPERGHKKLILLINSFLGGSALFRLKRGK